MRSSLITFAFLLFVVGISACTVLPQEKDPELLQTIPTEKTITLDGEIYPFSVSISTRATHRLANIDGKLIAYLHSDIVDLSQFESHVVEVDGHWRNEKMQEIFFVDAIRLQDVQTPIGIEDPTQSRFTTQNLTFLYPFSWEYSLSPTGVAYFTDKSDIQRRVFLTFSVEERTKKDELQTPNISVSGLMGFQKNTQSEVADKEQKTVTLLSQTSQQKYIFVFSGDTSQEKDFLLLVNSFIEGKEKVAQTLEEEKKQKALREASKIAQKEDITLSLEDEEDVSLKEQSSESVLALIEKATPSFNESSPQEKTPKTETEITKNDSSNISNIAQKYAESATITTSSEIQKTETDEKEDLTQAPPTTEVVSLSDAFENIIDERAFQYKSGYYNISLKVPFGFWFKNYGPSDGKLFRIGFAPHDITESNPPSFWLEGVPSETPVSTFTESKKEDSIILEFPRSKTSYFRFIGPSLYKDAMKSILLSIE